MIFDYTKVPDGCWVGVDLDATLAHYDGWEGPQHIGDPIKSVADFVKEMVEYGIDVRILTARVGPSKDNMSECRYAIEQWCERNLGFSLPITHAKDYLLYMFIDDRAVQVYPNKGISLAEEIEVLKKSREHWKLLARSVVPVEVSELAIEQDPYRTGV